MQGLLNILNLQIYFFLNYTGHHLIIVFVRERYNLYQPSRLGIYGSASNVIKIMKPKFDYFKGYELTRVKLKKKDRPDDRCNEDGSDINVEACIERFIESKVKCSSKFQLWKRRQPSCTTMEEYKKWNDFTLNITNLDETQIYKLTGCLASCNIMQYQMFSEEGLLRQQEQSPGTRDKFFVLRFMFSSGKYEEREQYYVYDIDSLIADVGGYMGLLLGHSLYSLYLIAYKLILVLKAKILRKCCTEETLIV